MSACHATPACLPGTRRARSNRDRRRIPERMRISCASSYSCFSILISSFYCSLPLVLFFPCRQKAEQHLRYPLGDRARLKEPSRPVPSRRVASRHTARVIAAKDTERVRFLTSQKYRSFKPAENSSTCLNLPFNLHVRL
jgi:hypothetical protein